MSPGAAADESLRADPGPYAPPRSDVGTPSYRAGAERSERYDSESAYIKHDIDRTRSHMDRTLDELGERLRPSNLIDSVVGLFAGASSPTTTGHTDESARQAAANVGSTVWEKVRENPLPSAAIAASIAYMFVKDDARRAINRARIRRNNAEPEMYGGSYVDARTGKPYDREHYGEEVHQDRSLGGRMADYAGDKASHAAESAGQGISRAASATAKGAKRAASWIGHKIGDATSSMADATGSAASSAGHAASNSLQRGTHAGTEYGRDVSRKASDYGRRGYAYSQERFDSAMREHPFSVGIAALAAGVLAGLAVPRTRAEDRTFGAQSRQAWDAASDAASEAYERGRHIVERGMNTAEEEARRQGIHPSQLKSEAGHLMDRAKEAASHLADDAKAETDSLRGDAESSHLNPQGIGDSAKAVAQATRDAVTDEAEHQKEEAKQEHGATP